MSSAHNKSDIPHELKGKLAAFDSALTTVEKRFQPLLDTPQIELNATVSLNNPFSQVTSSQYHYSESEVLRLMTFIH